MGGRKLGLGSLFSRVRVGEAGASSPSSWAWPSCKQPRTDSFRGDGQVYKTMNSVYLDSSESWLTNSSWECSSTASEEEERGSAAEAVIRGLRSERLFFEAGKETRSIVGEAQEAALEESVVVAVESSDPCGDFRASMEEMVAAHGMRGWGQLEELLVWYLRVNGRDAHGFVVGAFLELVVGLDLDLDEGSCSSSTSDTFEMR